MIYKKDDRPDCPACGDPLDETCKELAKAGGTHNHYCGAVYTVRKLNNGQYDVAYDGNA